MNSAKLRHTPALYLSRDEQALRYSMHRISYLPKQLEDARRKVAALENEARRYGMEHLL